MNGEEVVARIKALAIEKRISLGDLYRDCEISAAAVSQWKMGKTSPSAKVLQALSRRLNTTPAYLMFGVRETEKPTATDGSGLSEDEMEIIRMFRSASPEARSDLKKFLKSVGFGHDTQDDSSRKPENQ